MSNSSFYGDSASILIASPEESDKVSVIEKGNKNMKIKTSKICGSRSRRQGFTFVEVMVATAITVIMFISFYAAMSSGVRTIQVARENLRATEIILGQMEGIRLLNWSQVTNTTYLPSSFTVGYDSSGTNVIGALYSGTVTVVPVPSSDINTSYSGAMKKVTISLSWNSWGVTRSRTMTTYSSQYGVQPYVWSNN
jgi:prepilin-type N-terminal cleavage/methylation domain-containing protein